MNENLYGLFDHIVASDFSIEDEGFKKTILLDGDAEYGKMETYSIFPGTILSYIDMNIDNMQDVFLEDNISSRMLEINHCLSKNDWIWL